MGITAQLWRRLWEKEEQRKQDVLQIEVAHALKKANEKRDQNTPTQDLCIKHGYLAGNLAGNLAEDSAYKAMIANQQAILNQKVQAQAHYGHLMQQVGHHTHTATGTTSIGNPGSFHGSSAIYTAGTAGTAAGSYPVGVGPNHSQNLNYPHGVISNVPMTTLGSGQRDTFFLALKGIEEAAMKAPNGNHGYDDNAVDLLDMRKFNPDQIPLIGVVSFCLANMFDVESLLVLLEGFGMKVVQ